MCRHALFLMYVLLAAGSVLAQNAPVTQPAPAPLPALAPVPGPAAEDANPREDLMPFEGREVQVVWDDYRWQIMAGDRVLKDFGRHEEEARQALRLIQELGLTQRGTVGNP